jgi:hypothetical protein
MPSLRHRRRLKKLFAEDPRCHWCGQKTIWAESIRKASGRMPPNIATFEHLDSRFDPDRGTYEGVERTVLACYKCNHDRGRQRELLEFIWRQLLR